MKTLIIDWDNISDLKKNISLLQKRRKSLLEKSCDYNEIGFSFSRMNVNDIVPIFDFLYNIKVPGATGDALESKDYYVYVHCTPLKKLSISRDIRELMLASKYNLQYIPFYVGKGIGNRCDVLTRNEGHRKIRTSILEKHQDIVVVKVKEGLTEKEALFEEQKLISFLGLSSLSSQGMLVNLQTDSEILNLYTQQITEAFAPDIERLKPKAFKLIKLMKKWI